jgi:acetolactate synthase-1/2/3 large subunit
MPDAESDRPGTSIHAAAHHFLEGLCEIGVRWMFCNLGTDHAPLIEEMAAWKQAGRLHPGVVVCPHENLAVHMAGGYAFATGRGQAVMLHVDVGTANAAMGLHNLLRSRLPAFVLAGKAPFSSHGERLGGRDSYVNYVQENYDQHGLVRQYVKWDHTLASGLVVKEALHRGSALMHSAPPGPVYLSFAREVLTEPLEDTRVIGFDAALHGAVPARGTDPLALRPLVARLLEAREPMIVTAYAGRRHGNVALLDELARFAGIRVVETGPVDLNIPHDSPCFAGNSAEAFTATTDVGLMVDVDVPWIPRGTRLMDGAWWAHVDVDIVKADFPMWTFPRALAVQGDSERILGQLLEMLRAAATPAFRERAAARLARLEQEAAARHAHARRLAEDPGEDGQLNPHHLLAALQQAIPPDAFVVNEAIRTSPAVYAQMPRTVPGTVLGLAGGGLGFSHGAALGIQLAHPGRVVVQVVGDGSHYFGNPAAFHGLAEQMGLPVLSVVLDNTGWGAVKAATLRVYPHGHAQAGNLFHTQLPPATDFAAIARGAGAHGELLERVGDTHAAIRRCMDAVRAGRSALLHVRITPL